MAYDVYDLPFPPGVVASMPHSSSPPKVQVKHISFKDFMLLNGVAHKLFDEIPRHVCVDSDIPILSSSFDSYMTAYCS